MVYVLKNEIKVRTLAKCPGWSHTHAHTPPPISKFKEALVIGSLAYCVFSQNNNYQEVLSVLNSQMQNKTLGSWLKGGTFHLIPSAGNVVAVRTPSPAPLFLHCRMFSVNLAEARKGKTVGFRDWAWFPAWDSGYQESIPNETQTENHYFSPYIPYIFILERILRRQFFSYEFCI